MVCTDAGIHGSSEPAPLSSSAMMSAQPSYRATSHQRNTTAPWRPSEVRQWSCHISVTFDGANLWLSLIVEHMYYESVYALCMQGVLLLEGHNARQAGWGLLRYLQLTANQRLIVILFMLAFEPNGLLVCIACEHRYHYVVKAGFGRSNIYFVSLTYFWSLRTRKIIPRNLIVYPVRVCDTYCTWSTLIVYHSYYISYY